MFFIYLSQKIYHHLHEIEIAYFLDIPRRLYHIINLIFKIICRKKVEFIFKIEHFTY